MTKVSLLRSIFFPCLRNLGNLAEFFLHALSISKKYNIIDFLTLEGFSREWRCLSVVTCHKGILWWRLEFRGWVNGKQSKLSIYALNSGKDTFCFFSSSMLT